MIGKKVSYQGVKAILPSNLSIICFKKVVILCQGFNSAVQPILNLISNQLSEKQAGIDILETKNRRMEKEIDKLKLRLDATKENANYLERLFENERMTNCYLQNLLTEQKEELQILPAGSKEAKSLRLVDDMLAKEEIEEPLKMNIDLLREKMERFFNKVTPDQLVNYFESLGYEFENIKNQDQKGGIDFNKLREHLNEIEEETPGSFQQIDKKKDNLIEAQKGYIDFLTQGYNSMFSIAYVHGFRPQEKDIKRGQQMREEIETLQQSPVIKKEKHGRESKETNK